MLHVIKFNFEDNVITRFYSRSPQLLLLLLIVGNNLNTGTIKKIVHFKLFMNNNEKRSEVMYMCSGKEWTTFICICELRT